VEEPASQRAPTPEEASKESRAAAAFIGVLTAASSFLALRPSPPVIARPARHADAVVASPAAIVVVHVAGAVRRPGIYELPPTARIADAIESAGGALQRADLSLLNLAEPIRDGMQVLVARKGPGASVEVAPQASTGPALVDINLADQSALESVPGIGPVKAAAILEHRNQIGSFSSIGQLIEVTGIGPATLEAIRPYVTI